MERKKTAALFVDAENLYFIQKGLGWEIDFEKLYNFFDTHFSIYNAFYYTVVAPDQETYEEKTQFLDSLAVAGYTVRRKHLKIIHAGDKQIRKGNVDIEMVVDMFNTKDLYDVIVLFSGDSDFERALELLRSYGKEIIVVSARGYVSRELINAADKYTDLAVLKDDFAMRDNKGVYMPWLKEAMAKQQAAKNTKRPNVVRKFTPKKPQPTKVEPVAQPATPAQAPATPVKTHAHSSPVAEQRPRHMPNREGGAVNKTTA